MKIDLNNSVTKSKINTSWWKLAGVVFFCWMVMIYMDNVQQNQYESVREAYEQMEKEKYQIAMKMLLEYRDAHNSVVYWKMLELINGEDSEYTLGKIEAAIKKCKTQIIGNNNKNEK